MRQKIFPDLICVVAKHELYVKYHQRVFKEIDKYLCYNGPQKLDRKKVLNEI